MEIKKDVPLKDYSTYKIGGRARYFCEVADASDAEEAVKFASDKRLHTFVLGGGSNLIISDSGFDGLVIKVQDLGFRIYDLRIEVGAGFDMPELVKKTTKMGFAGLEWAGGLPGTLGGAIFGNAGCFGHEIKEIVCSVYAARITNYAFRQRRSAAKADLRITNYGKEESEFTYRNSKFKSQGDYVILSAMLQFQKGDASELQKLAQEKIDYRKNRHPLEYPNIGSIFKNIDEKEKVETILKHFPELEESVKNKWFGKVPCAVLVEKAGLAGKQIGGAQVSQKHANFIINKANAKAQDVVTLITLVKSGIKELFGIELEEEVRYVGF